MSEATEIIAALLKHNKTAESVFVLNSLKRLQEIFESQEEALSQYRDKSNWAKGSLKRFNGKTFNRDLWTKGDGWAAARKVLGGK